MPAIDPSIPLSAKAPDAMTSLGSLVNTAGGIQALRTGQLQQRRTGVALEQEQGALDARKAVGAVMSDPQYRDPDTGLLDLNKLAPAIQAADPKNYAWQEALQKTAQVNGDMMKLKASAMTLSDQQQAYVGQRIGALVADPTATRKDLDTTLDDVLKTVPSAKPQVDIIRGHVNSLDNETADKWRGVATVFRNQAFPLADQKPQTALVNNGQQNVPVQVNPLNSPVAPMPGATPVQNQLPPATPTFNPQTQQPGYLGPQPAAGAAPAPGAVVPPEVQKQRDDVRLGILQQERAREVGNPDVAARQKNLAAIDTEIRALQGGAPRNGFVPSGPPLGTEANVGGTVDVVNKDYAATADQARTASQDIGVLQNIKKFAKGAVTGVAGDRRAYIAGLAGLLHMDSAEVEKTNTDLLAKNTNMLALAGGDTNLAKLMAESANPNTHMTSEAIEDAANQVIAQRKLALAKQQYMQHFKGDPQQYSEKLAVWNKIADPRVLQLPDMSQAEKARMKAAMSPTEQREFGQKIREMQSLGLVQ